MKFIDLFSGIGGFRLALQDLNQECVFSADFDEKACETYKKNFGDYPFIDLKEYDPKKIPNHNILCAGFPCQPFSIAGFRKGFEDTRGTLFFNILNILQEKRPDAFILENVKGLVNHSGGNTFKHMLNFLAKEINGEKNTEKYNTNLGYSVYWQVLNSADFGVPQNRERIFIVGFKNSGKNFVFPNKVNKPVFITDIIDTNPEIKEISSLSKDHINRHLKLHSKYSEIKNLDYLIAYEIRKSRVAFRFDNKSPCLTTKMGTGGNNVPYLVNHNRFLTLSECLKIQGFPSNFKLTNSYSNALRQIGNSVSIPVVRAVVKNVLASITSA